jgi:hypothetical protein
VVPPSIARTLHMHTTLSPPESLHRAAQSLENSRPARRWAFWFGLITVWVFSVGFLQFGLIDHLAAPASQRVNNGEHGTFFALHTNPYGLFSEDFHLYVVRSKRILDRGWTDSPLTHTPHEKKSYAAPLQAALMMLAVATDGRPIPYSFFIVGVLAVAWTILYLAAAWWLPLRVSPLTVPIAVMVTVLFESIDGIRHSSGEFAQWPVHRGIRMSTLAWSNALELAVTVAAVSLLFRRERPTGRLVFIAVFLSAIAAADTWGFLFSAMCVGLVIASIGATAVVRRHTIGNLRQTLLIMGVLTGIAFSTLAINRLTSGAVKGDALTRAGFGEAWRSSPNSANQSDLLTRARSSAVFLLGMALLASAYIRFRPSLADRLLEARVVWRWPTPEALHVLCLAGIPVVAWLCVEMTLAAIGFYGYHTYQFTWRLDYIQVFCLVILVSETLKLLMRSRLGGWRRTLPLEITGTVALLAALLVYHNLRIYHFVKHTAAYEFFLTKDEEELGDWLRKREPSLTDPKHGNFTLATASHELNYLCAYWTNADLVLPEGFPYHNASSDDEIIDRMAKVLAIYGATPESWLAFNLNRAFWDQWSWVCSRVLAARHNYMYYLMHAEVMIDGLDGRDTKPTAPPRTTLFSAQLNLQRELFAKTGKYYVLTAGVREEEKIAERLRDLPPLTPKDRPDVIIVDDVSRGLGTPDLTDYRREFQHGHLEAWVLAQQ